VLQCERSANKSKKRKALEYLGVVHIQSEDVLKRGGVSDVSQWHGHHDTNTENKNARDRNKERCDVEQQNPPKPVVDY